MASLKDFGVAALAGAAGALAYNYLKKPDGTQLLDEAGSIGNVIKGSAKVISGLSENLATMSLNAAGYGTALSSIQSLTHSFSAGSRIEGGPPYANILEDFADYAPLWTMACLTPDQFNDPSLYRGIPGALTEVIFSSAGRYDSQRTKTAGGQPEYYINNFSMDHRIAPSEAAGLTNVIKLEFEIFEPYSMGYFMQSIQAAAINCGYPNHNGTPYLLKLEFAGNKDNGQLYQSTEALEKYFVIKIVNVTFTTNEAGSTYKVTATPMNHSGFSNVNNQLKTDIKLTGENVKEILTSGQQSLCVALNQYSKKQVDTGKWGVQDEYLIVFPESWDDAVGIEPSGAWSFGEFGEAMFDPTVPLSAPLEGRMGEDSGEYGNGPVGLSSLGFSATDGGNYNFGLEGDVTDEASGIIQRGILKIDPKQRTYNYSQGATIQNVIQSVVLSSDYAKAAIDPKNLTDEGMIRWFRVDVQQKIGELDILRNIRASRWIFRVVPFYVHSSIFRNPTSGPSGIDKLDEIVAKEYNYMYTGKNNDVLKFDITINNLFNVGKPITPPEDTATASNPDTQQSAEDPDQVVRSDEGGNAAATANEVGGTSSLPDPDATKDPVKGGRGAKSVEDIVALAMQNAILKGTGDLINIQLEILGDPFWITDHGMGNYLGESYGNPVEQITAKDQSLNYQGADCYFRIIFRTPVEPGVLEQNKVSGLYVFPDGESENPYSGIYRVTTLTSKFSDGMFKQTLNAVRLNPQPKDIPGGPRSSPNPFNMNAKETDTISTSPNDDAAPWNDFAADEMLMADMQDAAADGADLSDLNDWFG